MRTTGRHVKVRFVGLGSEAIEVRMGWDCEKYDPDHLLKCDLNHGSLQITLQKVIFADHRNNFFYVIYH